MLGPDDAVTRRLSCGDAAKLLQCSPLAMRAFLALFWGEDSERAGLSRCRPGALAEVLGSSRRAVVSALDELQSIGLIKWSADEGLAIRDGFALANWPKDWPNSRAWANTIMRLRDGLIVSELRESLRSQLQAASQATSKAASEATSQATSEAIVRQSVSPSVRQSNSTPLPTVAAPTGAKVAKEGKKGATDDRAAQLIAEYTRLCPSLPKVPPSALKAATAALKREPDLDAWLARFARAEASDFLAGRKTDWRANILWLLGPINVGKLDAGQYDNHRARNGPGPGMMRTPAGWMPEPVRTFDEPDVLF